MTNTEIREKHRKLAAVDPRAAQLHWMFLLSGDSAERAETENLMDIVLNDKVQHDYRERIFLDPVSKELCPAPYTLGKVMYPPHRVYASFGLREDEWIKHVLITGMTGTGKTNLVFQILTQFQEHGKPFLVFDWKRNYRDLLQLPAFSRLQVFTVAQPASPFHFNPLLPPPGMPPGEWLMKLVDVIKHAYFVGEGVEFLLREAIDRIYQNCEMFSETPRTTPMFLHVRFFIHKRHTQGRMALWKASAVRVLESLCFRHGLGPVVNTEQHWDYGKLLNSPVVLELDALSDADKIFLTEAIILWLYEYRKREGQRETFKHALIIEEAHHVLSHFKEHAEGAETIMETCLRQIREFGEAVIAVDQEPTKLSNSIKANTYCKITFNLGNGKDILDIANCMGLDKEEAEFLNLLPVGHSIVTLKDRVFVPLHVVYARFADNRS